LADPAFHAAVSEINRQFRDDWVQAGLQPAPRAADSVHRRRLSLALAGTIPSLEEQRQWLTRSPDQSDIHDWVDYLLADRRSSDYLAERFARTFVGTENGPFILYRRRRFVTWLSDTIHANQPYDELVRQLITETGLRTDRPAVNFVTVTLDPNDDNQPDEIRLASRTTRAFLGVRLDCVQCHDDNLGGPWTQADFHQLAAFYSECQQTVTGIHDKPRDYNYQYLHAEQAQVVEPVVPFFSQLAGAEGNRRERLAAWVTHPENQSFARTLVNRVWALLLGRPLVEPIDSIPLEGPYPPGLELMARDFVSHGYDLQRLIHLIVATEVFQLDSQAKHELRPEHEQHWASFPVTRLRPEQVVGAVIQACSLNTLDRQSHILVRLMRLGQQQDFIKRYGDPGEDEFISRGGTIPQRLLMMNGQLMRERTEDNIVFNAATRIAALANDSPAALETTYRAVLGRAPTAEEQDYFLQKWRENSDWQPKQAVEDLYWVLLNSTEFSWNH
jgi:hypothetical protein